MTERALKKRDLFDEPFMRQRPCRGDQRSRRSAPTAKPGTPAVRMSNKEGEWARPMCLAGKCPTPSAIGFTTRPRSLRYPNASPDPGPIDYPLNLAHADAPAQNSGTSKRTDGASRLLLRVIVQTRMRANFAWEYIAWSGFRGCSGTAACGLLGERRKTSPDPGAAADCKLDDTWLQDWQLSSLDFEKNAATGGTAGYACEHGQPIKAQTFSLETNSCLIRLGPCLAPLFDGKPAHARVFVAARSRFAHARMRR